MDTAKRPSYFSLCRGCGGHGHIVCSDDDRTESAEFATVSEGLQALTALTLSEKIPWDEALDVKLQIEMSGLEPDNPATDGYLEWSMDQPEPGQPEASADADEKRSPRRRKRTVN